MHHGKGREDAAAAGALGAKEAGAKMAEALLGRFPSLAALLSQAGARMALSVTFEVEGGGRHSRPDDPGQAEAARPARGAANPEPFPPAADEPPARPDPTTDHGLISLAAWHFRRALTAIDLLPRVERYADMTRQAHRMGVLIVNEATRPPAQADPAAWAEGGWVPTSGKTYPFTPEGSLAAARDMISAGLCVLAFPPAAPADEAIIARAAELLCAISERLAAEAGKGAGE